MEERSGSGSEVEAWCLPRAQAEMEVEACTEFLSLKCIADMQWSAQTAFTFSRFDVQPAKVQQNTRKTLLEFTPFLSRKCYAHVGFCFA